VWNLGPRVASPNHPFGDAVGELQAQDAGAAGEHYKVSFVAVLPHMQGRGLATSVLRAMLATVDADGRACYLFTANDRNEAMYARHGFATRSRRPMGAGAGAAGEEMTIRSMLRPAASS
jgi:GNAT superfamily N-acetyltransferase